jgi:hypothetical protein
LNLHAVERRRVEGCIMPGTKRIETRPAADKGYMTTTATRPVRPSVAPPAAAPLPRAGSSERRRSMRHPLAASGMISLDPEALEPKQLQVIIINVSLHGVGFRSPVGFVIGDRHAVRIGAGPLHLSSNFEVVNVHEREDGMYDIGAKFV